MRIRTLVGGPAGLAVDVGLGVAAVVALAVTGHALSTSWGGGSWLLDCVAGALVCLAALLRRLHRGWAAAVGLTVAGAAVGVAEAAGLPHEPGPAAVLGLAVLVGSATRALPPPRAGVVAAGGLAVVAGSWLSGGFTPVPVLAGMAFLGALAVGLSLRLADTRRRAVRDDVRRHERLELARELHDVAAHHLTGIVLQAQAAHIVARRRPAELDASLVGIEAAGSEALAAMRRVVGVLRDGDDAAPVTVGPDGLEEMVRRFEEQGPPVELRLPADNPVWPAEVTGTVHRIVQEALTNVIRHAPRARSVAVVVGQDGPTVTVEVVDDAPAQPTRHPGRAGYGLLGMRERVESLGGALHAGPRPGGGWSVRASLPVPGRADR